MARRRKKPRIHLDELPPKVDLNEVVSIDIEGFEMDGDRLHRPSGRFASLQIGLGDDVYMVRDLKHVVPAIKRIRKGDWTLHKAQFDLQHLGWWTGKPELFEHPVERLCDTMLIDQLLWAGYYERFALDDCVRRYLDIRLDKSVRDRFSEGGEWDKALISYAADDPFYTLRVREAQEKLLAADHPLAQGFETIWRKIEAPMIYVLMDWKGSLIDVPAWMVLSDKNKEIVERIRDEADFNPGSHQQVKARLHAEGIKIRNVQAGTLEPYLARSETARIRAEYVKAQKRWGTYGEKWVTSFVEEDGRVYSDYFQIGTVTGREASSDPNLQNIPVREGPEYRRCFIAPPKCKLIVADYEQQEPKVTAFLSQDKALLRAVQSKVGSHLSVAREIFDDVGLTKLDSEYDDAKVINLGLVYGMTPRGVARKTGKTEWEAEMLVNRYFDKYPDVETWMARSRANASEDWHVTSVGGRVVWINLYDRQWDNYAVNYPVQSSGADILKRSQVLIRDISKSQLDIPLPLILSVHDEVVAEPPRGMVRQVTKAIRDATSEAGSELCPGMEFPVEIHVGKTWAAKYDK